MESMLLDLSSVSSLELKVRRLQQRRPIGPKTSPIRVVEWQFR
jgi:hypothetical protein